MGRFLCNFLLLNDTKRRQGEIDVACKPDTAKECDNAIGLN